MERIDRDKRREEGGEKPCCRRNRPGRETRIKLYVWDLQGVYTAGNQARTDSEQRQHRNL